MNKHCRYFVIAAMASCMTAFSQSLMAFETQWGDMSLRLDSSVTIGSAWRVESPNPNLIAQSNGGKGFSSNSDDGNLAFGKGDPVVSGMKLTSDLTFNYASVGLFLRGYYRYDRVGNSKSYFNSEFYQGPPQYTQSAADLREKRRAVKDEVGNNLDILDAYLFGGFEVADRYVAYRVGRQVLNWGESLFIQNGLNSILSVNANRLRMPGFEVEELYEPAGMVLVDFQMFDNLAVEAFYQFEWRETVIDASGTFWSTNDFVGIGGNAAEIGFGRCPENSAPGTCAFAPGGSSIPRGSDIEPADGGQYGLAFRFLVPQLNEMDVGIYMANYHSRLPVVSGNAVLVPGVAPSGRFQVEYPEDIQLFGVSFNTGIGKWAVQGEYSYKKDQPLAIDEVELFLAGLRAGQPSQIGTYGPGEFIQGWRRFDVSQIDISATRIIGPIDLIKSDQLVLLAEVGATKVHSMPSEDELRLEGPGTYLPGDPAVAAALGVPAQDGGYADENSWGYRLGARLQYNNVFNMFTLEPGLLFAHDVSGTSPTPIINFVDGRKQISAGLKGKYLDSWEGGISYTRYAGGEPFNLMDDRDYMSMYLKYSF